ncbi:MAG: FAD-binding oxidoreductase [Rhodospirillales bacterium]
MPPPSITSPATFTDPLPGAVDVVVIGAGIIGIATAWHLARAGVRVLVCEKGRVAGEQSSRNWGWVRQQGRDPDELPIMMESIRIWSELSAETGEDVGFRRNGVVYVAETDEDMESFGRWLEIAREHQLDTRLLTADELADLIPGLRGPWKGALHTPSDGRAEPFVAVPALARAAQRAGAAIAENCAVRVVETTGGAVSAVVTEHGTVRCDRVVVAGGAWSSLFLRNLGIDLPQLSVKETVVRTQPGPEVFSGNAATGTLAFRRREDGGYSLAAAEHREHFVSGDSVRYLRPFWPLLRQAFRTVELSFTGNPMATPAPSRWTGADVSPFEYVRVLDPKPEPKLVALIEQRLKSQIPELKDIGRAEAWSGMIDTTPDVLPVIDEAPLMAGLFIATGFSGHGFGIGPGAGRVIADLLRGRPAGHDLTRFRFSRFSDGSRMDPGPAL